MSCFHCFLYIFHKSGSKIKPALFSVIYRHSVCCYDNVGNRSKSKFLEISNTISLNIIISERENVVKLNTDARKTSNVTCGKFECRRDSDIIETIFCCEIQ